MRLGIVAKVFVCIFGVHLCSCVEFNRETTGVGFSAYVKRKEGKNAQIPGWKTYTIDDIKTMLEVISTKFSKVASFGVGADNVAYEGGGKTYRESSAQVMTAEAAALINAERQNLSLTVLVGVWQSDQRQQMQTEVLLALETINKANDIFPGTAIGLVFSQNDIHSSITRAKQTLEYIREVRNISLVTGKPLKIGTRQDCNKIAYVDADDPNGGKLAQVRGTILTESDFVICTIEAAEHNLPSGAENGFITVQNDLLQFRRDFQEIFNRNIDVMGQTGWASKGNKKWENIENLEKYWVTVDKWATENNFKMWMFEAFDNPWKDWSPNSGYYGWWKLRSNALTSSAHGYAEKIYEPPDVEPIGWMLWVYIGVGLGAALICLVLAAVGILYFRVQSLQETISNNDIKEFMYGISDEAAAQQAQGGNIETALKFPYDKSYEINKESLQIRRDVILGSGQFGCVYRALIDNDEKTEVALKMAKLNCPKNALITLLSEIKILTYLGKHPNIVSIQGAYTGELQKGIVYVATELCSLGSLEDYLRKVQTGSSGGSSAVDNDRYANSPTPTTIYTNVEETELNGPGPTITYSDMVRWSHEIACGMEYLGVKHVVHADLSTRNVLLASDKTAKITDFGLSRRLYDYTNYVKKQQEPLPWRWMAVESLKRLEFSAKSDVWSYGVTLWEIFSMGDLPYPGLSWNLDFVENLVNGLRMKSPPHATPEVYQIMVSTWHLDPKERPSFTDLKISTGELLGSSGQNVESQ